MTDRPAPPYPNAYPDEISLRDLYLTLRAGLPWILLATIAAAAITFLVLTLLPSRYVAEATVVVSPTPVRVQGTAALAFDPSNAVSFETYEEVALNRKVLSRAVQDANASGWSASELGAGGEVVRISGPARADQTGALTIAHRVAGEDPEAAAALANAWAQASLETVRAQLLASIDPVLEETAREGERRQAELEAVQAEWQAFQSRDESDLLTARLEALAERAALGEDELLLLERGIAAAEGGLAALAAQLGERAPGGGNAGDAAALTRLFGAMEAVDPELAARLAPLLELSPGSGDAVRQLARAHLLETATTLAATVAERDRLEARLAADVDRAEDLRERLAGLLQERARLQARLSRALRAVDEIAALQPTISYLRSLTATTTRVLNEATPPLQPSGRSRLLMSALAAVAAFGLATLVVLLREAVRPEPAG